MIATTTVSFVPMSKIFELFKMDDVDVEGFCESIDYWGWGDTNHTLVGNMPFWYALSEFLGKDDDETRNLFWNNVPEDAFIDLEN